MGIKIVNHAHDDNDAGEEVRFWSVVEEHWPKVAWRRGFDDKPRTWEMEEAEVPLTGLPKDGLTRRNAERESFAMPPGICPDKTWHGRAVAKSTSLAKERKKKSAQRLVLATEVIALEEDGQRKEASGSEPEQGSSSTGSTSSYEALL